MVDFGDSLLASTSIGKSFGGISAVKEVSVQLGAGEVLALVGPNGSGKTTLMSILLGLQRPDGGRVRLLGADVTRVPANSPRRRAMAATFQTPQLIESLTCRENVELGARLKGFPGGQLGLGVRIDELLESLGLQRVAGDFVFTLSGGQRKLVELARAVVVEPLVLLLDEPTAGVSAAMESVLSDRISQVKRSGAGVLVVSHNLPWALALCDRVVVLVNGSVLAQGTPAQVQGDSRVIEAYMR